MPNVITRCHCTSNYQDAAYGAGQRVHTVGANAATCTPRYCPNCAPPRGEPSSGHPEPPDALDHAFTACWDARYGSYVPEPPGPYSRSTICDILGGKKEERNLMTTTWILQHRRSGQYLQAVSRILKNPRWTDELTHAKKYSTTQDMGDDVELLKVKPDCKPWDFNYIKCDVQVIKQYSWQEMRSSIEVPTW